MNKESCSSLVFIKFANGESFGVCVCGAGSVKKKNVFTVHIYLYCTVEYVLYICTCMYIHTTKMHLRDLKRTFPYKFPPFLLNLS